MFWGVFHSTFRHQTMAGTLYLNRACLALSSTIKISSHRDQSAFFSLLLHCKEDKSRWLQAEKASWVFDDSVWLHNYCCIQMVRMYWKNSHISREICAAIKSTKGLRGPARIAFRPKLDLVVEMQRGLSFCLKMQIFFEHPQETESKGVPTLNVLSWHPGNKSFNYIS